LKRFLPLFILLFVFFSDQTSKIVVRAFFSPGKVHAGQQVRLIGDFFWINYHENKGIAFGLFSGLPNYITIPVFALITLVAIWIIIHFYRELPKGLLTPRIALMMIMGGAIGNLTDRIIFGKVTDFLDIAVFQGGIYKNIWPIFNLADVFIVIGVITLMTMMLLGKKLEEKTAVSFAEDIKQTDIPPVPKSEQGTKQGENHASGIS